MRLIIAFLFTLVSISAFGQNTNTFYRKYNLSGMQGALGLVAMPDGGFVGTGQHENNGSAGDCDVYVYRIDECGTLIWMKLIGTAAMEGGKCIQLRANGNLLIVGLYNGKGMIFEMDPNGNLLWEKRYDNTTFTLGISECPNGDLAVTCMTITGEFAVMRTDPIGNILWSKTFLGLGDYPISCLALSNGNIFVNSTFNILGKDFGALLLDPLGNIIWSRTYGGVGFTLTDYQSWGTKAVYDAVDQTVLVVGQTFVNGSDDILFAKLNLSDGSVVWSKVIGDLGSEQARDVVRTRFGFAILGNTDGYPMPAAANPTLLSEDMAERDVLLLNLDSLGNFIWAKTYGGIERDKGIGLRWDSSGTFLINAYTSSPVFGNTDLSMDPLFIKTDSNGVVGCQYSSPSVTVQNIVLDVDTVGTTTTNSIAQLVSTSVISSFVPVDTFQCLQCATVPQFSASDTMICVSDSVDFYNMTTIGLICFQKWNVNGSLYSGTMDTIRYAFSAPGTYPIKLYSDCGSSTDTFTLNIHVFPQPVNSFSVPNNCENDPTVFSNTSSITSGFITNWQWDFGDNNISFSQNPTHTYSTPGSYVVRLATVSDYGCIDIITDSVIVYPLPIASFLPNNFCQSQVFNAVSTSQSAYPITNYSWNFGDGSLSSGSWSNHSFQSAGNYNVQLSIADTNGCVDNFISMLSVFPTPVAIMELPPRCEVLPEARFKNHSTGSTSWQWDFGDQEYSNDFAPTHRYQTLGTYYVNLKSISDKGCVDSTNAIIQLDQLYNFWVPNAFTPNSDGFNDRFSPKTQYVSDYKMEIYDRWGLKVFSTTDPEYGWDATIDGHQAQNDVYIYRVSLIDFCGEEHSYVGHFSLMK